MCFLDLKIVFERVLKKFQNGQRKRKVSDESLKQLKRKSRIIVGVQMIL